MPNDWVQTVIVNAHFSARLANEAGISISRWRNVRCDVSEINERDDVPS